MTTDNNLTEIENTYVFSGRSLVKSDITFIPAKHPEYSSYTTTTNVWAIFVKEGTKIFRYRVAINKDKSFKINTLNSPMPINEMERCDYHKNLLLQFINQI